MSKSEDLSRRRYRPDLSCDDAFREWMSVSRPRGASFFTDVPPLTEAEQAEIDEDAAEWAAELAQQEYDRHRHEPIGGGFWDEQPEWYVWAFWIIFFMLALGGYLA
jgi:hypothetical protein